jgi:hypothetical protein
LSTSPLTQQGIDAYKAGNKEEAVRLLSDAVRQNSQDEEAWLYLGAAIDDSTRKRQAFEKVLAINPDNERAKNALARLNTAGASAAGSAASSANAAAARMSAGASAAGDKAKAVWSGQQGFAVPGNIEGAPPTVTIPEIISNGRTRIMQGLNIYQNQDYEQVVAAGQNATMWDSVSIALTGVLVVGLAVLVGRLIGYVLGGFAFNNIFVGLLYRPIFGAIAQMIVTAAGYAGAVYASRFYLQNQNINVPMAQHSMYYAVIWLPMTVIGALFTFLANAFLPLACLTLPVAIGLGLYGTYLLWKAFERVYGKDGNRGLITAVAALIGSWAAAFVVSLVLGVLRVL